MIFWYSLLLTATFLSSCSAKNVPCDLRETAYGSVCVCTAEHCDYLDNPEPLPSHHFNIISSTKAGLRFASSDGEFGSERKHIIKDDEVRFTLGAQNSTEEDFDPIALLVDEEEGASLDLANGSLNIPAQYFTQHPASLSIDRGVEFQKIVGFGGAFTGAVSHVLQQINQTLQDQVYKSFFAKDGIAFNIIRMAIGGTDFDLGPWAYNELPQDDVGLSNFTQLDARDVQKLQQLKRMKQVAQVDEIKIKAAAWSPPKWMKSNNAWNGLSHLKPEYYQTWADYHLRFIELMDAQNFPIWAISTGNEPTNGFIASFFVKFLNLGWTPKNQAIWLSENLGPTIKNSTYKNVLILGNDDQRFTFPSWFHLMNHARPGCLDYLDGLAVHWYLDNLFSPKLLQLTHDEMPGKIMLNTESCAGSQLLDRHEPELGSWERAEQYLHGYIQDLQYSANGWIDWNIALDEHGGPNYVNNFVDAPVIVNVTNRAEIYKQPIFYAIGHFSKFIPEGSVRIEAQTSKTNIKVVAFKRPDKRIAAVVFNSRRTPVDVELNDSVRGNIVINLPARSVHTIIYN